MTDTLQTHHSFATDRRPEADMIQPLRAIFLPTTWGIATKNVLAPRFEQERGIAVEIDLVGRDAIHDLMSTLFAAGDASYDVFNIDYNWVPEFAAGGHLLPLDGLITNLDGFLPEALRVARFRDRLFSLPQSVHPHLLWYRRDLFEAGGLAPPATMDEWLAAVRHFHNREIDGRKLYGWAAQAVRGYGNVHTWLTFLYSFGGDTFRDGSFLEPTLNSPAAIAAASFWAEMMRYTPPGIEDYGYDEVINAAAAGEIATCLHGSWGAFAVDEPARSSTVGQWEFVNVPAASASVPHLAEWMVAISSYSRQRDAAVAFLDFLESPDNDVQQALLGGGDPVRSASYHDPRLVTVDVEGWPNLRRFRRYPQVLAAMRTARPRPLFEREEQWETVVSRSLCAIHSGELSAREGLDRAQQAVVELLREAAYREP